MGQCSGNRQYVNFYGSKILYYKGFDGGIVVFMMREWVLFYLFVGLELCVDEGVEELDSVFFLCYVNVGDVIFIIDFGYWCKIEVGVKGLQVCLCFEVNCFLWLVLLIVGQCLFYQLIVEFCIMGGGVDDDLVNYYWCKFFFVFEDLCVGYQFVIVLVEQMVIFIN